MSGDLAPGTKKGQSCINGGAVDLSASLTSRVAAGIVVRVGETPTFSMSSGQRSHPVDLDRPFVCLTRDCSGESRRGDLLYPIGDEGGVAGAHSSEGYVNLASLNMHRANFTAREIGKGVIALEDLVKTSGTHTGISVELEGKEVRFYLSGSPIDQADAVETLLDHYAMLRIPENVRTAGKTSKVGAQEQIKHESGIICESLEEVASLLKCYDSRSISSSRATNDHLEDDVWAEGGGLEVQLFKVARKSPAREEASFVDCLISKIREAAEEGREFSKRYEEVAAGSFFKTTVEVRLVDSKFILRISAAYVGNEPERELAIAENKERALYYVGAKYPLTRLAENFVGVDLGAVFTETEFNPELIAKTAAREILPNTTEEVTVNGEHGTYAVFVELRQEDDCSPDVFRAKGTGLFMHLNCNRGEPYVTLVVRIAAYPGVAISKEQKAEMTEIRDRLATLISQAHS